MFAKHSSGEHLEDAVESTLPRGPRLDLLALPVNGVPVEFTTAGVNVHLRGAKPSLALPEVAADPEERDDEEGEVVLEEGLGGTNAHTNRRDGSVELETVRIFFIEEGTLCAQCLPER
jgi:hypothetical protein